MLDGAAVLQIEKVDRVVPELETEPPGFPESAIRFEIRGDLLRTPTDDVLTVLVVGTLVADWCAL